MDKGIMLWAAFLAVIVIGMLISRSVKSGIKENGIETDAVVSRIVDDGTQTEGDINVYVRYRTDDGEEIEGILSNPLTDLKEGQHVYESHGPLDRERGDLLAPRPLHGGGKCNVGTHRRPDGRCTHHSLHHLCLLHALPLRCRHPWQFRLLQRSRQQ